MSPRPLTIAFFGVDSEWAVIDTATPAHAVRAYAEQVNSVDITDEQAQRIVDELEIETSTCCLHLTFPTEDGDTFAAWFPRTASTEKYQPTGETRPCVFLNEDDQYVLYDTIENHRVSVVDDR